MATRTPLDELATAFADEFGSRLREAVLAALTNLPDRELKALPVERIAFSVSEAALALGISRSLAYEGVRTGAIPSIQIGARRLVPKAGLEKALNDAVEGAAR